MKYLEKKKDKRGKEIGMEVLQNIIIQMNGPENIAHPGIKKSLFLISVIFEILFCIFKFLVKKHLDFVWSLEDKQTLLSVFTFVQCCFNYNL